MPPPTHTKKPDAAVAARIYRGVPARGVHGPAPRALPRAQLPPGKHMSRLVFVVLAASFGSHSDKPIQTQNHSHHPSNATDCHPSLRAARRRRPAPGGRGTRPPPGRRARRPAGERGTAQARQQLRGPARADQPWGGLPDGCAAAAAGGGCYGHHSHGYPLHIHFHHDSP